VIVESAAMIHSAYVDTNATDANRRIEATPKPS